VPGEPRCHAGVYVAGIGWVRPGLHDRDGHEVRFYTQQHHTEPDPGGVTAINNPWQSAERREGALAELP
jgi:hypothetical protein